MTYPLTHLWPLFHPGAGIKFRCDKHRMDYSVVGPLNFAVPPGFSVV